MTAAPFALAYVGLGSNLGDRAASLHCATEALRAGAVPRTVLLRGSPVFETRPLGPSLHPFLNAAVVLCTRLRPHDLLSGLLALEEQHGRLRRERWEARTLDLDLLVWTVDGDSQQLRSPRLTLPHPELVRRDFVLAPLAALRPDLRPYGAATVTELLAAIADPDRTILAHGEVALC